MVPEIERKKTESDKKEDKRSKRLIKESTLSHEKFYKSVMKICEKGNLSAGDLREIFQVGYEFFKRKRSAKNGAKNN